MQVETYPLQGLLKLTPRKFGDVRGFFSETYNAETFSAAGLSDVFVQDNQSFSRQRGVVRGLHCQIAPYDQGKLVRVLKGAIWDVAVDIRTGSPTYGQHVAVELSADNWNQFYIPPGFLHGFCTLTEDTEVFYKCTRLYHPASERGVIWNDPALAIPWPVSPAEAVLSDKDRKLPALDAAKGWFTS